MALKNRRILSLLLFLVPTYGLASQIILPELLAKQAVNNIRFLTKDGKFTYYQKRSGSLIFSTNYKVQEIIKSEIGTTYTLFGSSSRKKIIILQNPNFHNFLSIRAKEKIYIVNYGENVPVEVGMGVGVNWLEAH